MDRDLPESVGETFGHEIITGLHEWRLQHPDATLSEIEQGLDERWYRVRARMPQDLALERETATWHPKATEPPTCPDCGRKLIRRGRQPRQLKTHGNHLLTLTLSYGYCPACK